MLTALPVVVVFTRLSPLDAIVLSLTDWSIRLRALACATPVGRLMKPQCNRLSPGPFAACRSAARSVTMISGVPPILSYPALDIAVYSGM